MTAYTWTKACPGVYYLWLGEPKQNPVGKAARMDTGAPRALDAAHRHGGPGAAFPEAGGHVHEGEFPVKVGPRLSPMTTTFRSA